MRTEKLEQALRDKQQKQAAKGNDPAKAKLTKKDREKVEDALPDDLIAALGTDHADLQKAGWNQPPGSQWVEYLRPRQAFGFALQRPPQREATQHPTVARFAIASSVPPRLTDALPFADRARAALLSKSDSHPVFLGRDKNGKPQQGHSHAFFLPESSGAAGPITHLTLYARRGFDREARLALEKLRKVWGHGGHDVQLILLGVGDPDDFAGFREAAGQCRLLATSRIWESYTPFVPTRHPKVRNNGTPRCDESGLQIDSPEHELRRLLRTQGCPEIRSATALEGVDLGGHFTRWLAFRTLRKQGSGRRSSQRGRGFRIEFAEPWSGPLAVGFGAHFGLGLFAPVSHDD